MTEPTEPPRDPGADVAERIHRAAGAIHAPDRLRAQVDGVRAAPPRRPRRTWALAGAATASAAVFATALVLILAPAATSPPTAASAAGLALSAPSQPAPRLDTRDARYVDVSVGGVPFPRTDYDEEWRPVGSREVSITGHRAVAVTYRRGTDRLGYAIVDGPPLPAPPGARRGRVGTTPVWVFTRNGARVVTWRRGGRTCVIASRTAPMSQLLGFVGDAT